MTTNEQKIAALYNAAPGTKRDKQRRLIRSMQQCYETILQLPIELPPHFDELGGAYYSMIEDVAASRPDRIKLLLRKIQRAERRWIETEINSTGYSPPMGYQIVEFFVDATLASIYLRKQKSALAHLGLVWNMIDDGRYHSVYTRHDPYAEIVSRPDGFAKAWNIFEETR